MEGAGVCVRRAYRHPVRGERVLRRQLQRLLHRAVDKQVTFKPAQSLLPSMCPQL